MRIWSKGLQMTVTEWSKPQHQISFVNLFCFTVSEKFLFKQMIGKELACLILCPRRRHTHLEIRMKGRDKFRAIAFWMINLQHVQIQAVFPKIFSKINLQNILFEIIGRKLGINNKKTGTSLPPHCIWKLKQLLTWLLY